MSLSIFNIFKRHKKQPQPLAIEGVPPAPITPEPDDAELAAQAVLEMMSDVAKRRGTRRNPKAGQAPDVPAGKGQDAENPAGKGQDAAYYQALAERIREAHRVSALRAMRFVAYVEQQLRNPHLPFHGQGSLAMLEVELYKRIDIIEREGGDLKRRWQHCLAVVTVRMMDDARNGRGEDG